VGDLVSESHKQYILLKRRKNLYLISLIMKEFYNLNIRKDRKLKKRAPKTKAYSRGIIDPKCLAPAMLHNDASLLILAITTFGMVEVFRKTLAFLSFHIS
jgi:hypothetical protein